jgi:ribonuclease-3
MNKLRITELYAAKNLQSLEKKLGHTFKDQPLLIQSVTRKGHVKELKDNNPDCERPDNERLEFLGDSVLELIMRKHLYETMPDSEGVLTKKCGDMVKKRSLTNLAFDFGLDEHIFLASSEEGNLRRKPRILADSLEAVIGAVFLETDYCSTTDIVLNRIFHL